jgi:oxygen-dependent protoporphyrinogen oxidase
LVIGAGISGLTCAYALKKSGQNVQVVEAGSRPGGLIQSVAEHGYLFELGPQSFGATAALSGLCDELDLNYAVVEAPSRAPRYVWIGGRLTPVPLTLPAFLASGLLGWKSKVAVLTEPLRITHPPDKDESVAAFTRRKFSGQLLERLVDPFVSGIYAGDAEQISLRAAFPRVYEAEKSAGSVVRGMIRAAKRSKATVAQSGSASKRTGLISFRSGNATLVRALADKLGRTLCCNSAVTQVTRTGTDYLVQLQSHNQTEQISCARLVIAAPTRAAAKLLEALSPEASRALQSVSYAPVAVVSLGYRRDQIRNQLEGFGFLAPRSSGIRTLGTVWNSSLFPGRAPEGQVLLTSFVGGATDASAASFSQQELSQLVQHELRLILGVSGQPAVERVTQYTQAIPQYNLGHSELLQTAQQALAALPGLWVVGNYWQGAAVGACLDRSLAVAEQVRISYNS